MPVFNYIVIFIRSVSQYSKKTSHPVTPVSGAEFKKVRLIFFRSINDASKMRVMRKHRVENKRQPNLIRWVTHSHTLELYLFRSEYGLLNFSCTMRGH